MSSNETSAFCLFLSVLAFNHFIFRKVVYNVWENRLCLIYSNWGNFEVAYIANKHLGEGSCGGAFANCDSQLFCLLGLLQNYFLKHNNIHSTNPWQQRQLAQLSNLEICFDYIAF